VGDIGPKGSIARRKIWCWVNHTWSNQTVIDAPRRNTPAQQIHIKLTLPNHVVGWEDTIKHHRHFHRKGQSERHQKPICTTDSVDVSGDTRTVEATEEDGGSIIEHRHNHRETGQSNKQAKTYLMPKNGLAKTPTRRSESINLLKSKSFSS
jgi:hypothetical protein